MGVPLFWIVGSFSCMRIWRIRTLLRVRMRGDMHLVPAIFFPLIAGSEESRTGRMSNVPVFILLERVICFVNISYVYICK